MLMTQDRPVPIEVYLEHAQLRAHRAKVAQAREELVRAAVHGKLIVGSSWGKDSCALLHLVLETLGPVEVLHLGSPYQLPGYDDLLAWAQERCQVHTLESGRTLAQTVEWLRDIGLPHERTKAQQAKVVQGLKKDKARAWLAEHGYQAQVLGMRGEESRGRRQCFRFRGLTYQLSDGLTICNPLGWWSARDVWAYILANGVPYNRRIYDAETHGLTRETIRNTGWLSTDGAHQGRLVWLRQHFPEQWRALLAEWPHLSQLS